MSKKNNYWQYIWQNTLNELKHRYSGSIFGLIWLLLYPLIYILIYSLVFTQIMELRIIAPIQQEFSFALYLCSGLLPWFVFAESVNRCTSLLVNKANHILIISIPEQVLFAQEALSCFVSMCIGMTILFIVYLILGNEASVAWLFVPLILLLFSLLTFGLGMMLGVLNVFSKDFGHIINMAIQIAFWTVPIVYVESILPDKIRQFITYNPLYPFISSLHDSVIYLKAPTMGIWGAMFAVVFVSLGFGYYLLSKMRRDIRDSI